MGDGRKVRAPLRLASGPGLPDLRVAAAADVYLHEDCDPTRVERLSARLREDGVLRNPPIVAALPEGGYVVLDGANRTSALRALDVASIPVQVVDYDDPAIHLDVWRHFVLGIPDLPDRLARRGLPLASVTPAEAQRRLAQGRSACYLATPAATVDVPVASGDPVTVSLARVVDAYKGTARIYRVQSDDRDMLTRQYGAGLLIVFPRFTKDDIVAIARQPQKIPTGITRHIIVGRALRLNLPLDALASPRSLDEKNRWLGDLVRQKLLDNRIRHYPEATFLFDE